MTAPSKVFTAVADTAVDPDSPLDTALITALRDNGIHNYEWIGFGYTPSQAHTHDGVDSALVEIGPNLLRNGSFESDLNGWTVSNYTGGSHAVNTAQEMDGAKCLAITSTSTANGGAQALANEYIPITGGEGIDLKFAIKASLANVSARAEAIWYDDAKAQISVSTLYNVTNAPTSLTALVRGAAAPSNARFLRVQLTGGVPGSGSAAGTIYFDGVRLSKSDWAEPGIYITSPSISSAEFGNVATKRGEIVAPKSGVYRVFLSLASGDGNWAYGRIYKNGAAFGTQRQAVAGNSWTEDLAFVKGDLIQMYLWHTGSGGGSSGSFRLQESSPNAYNGAAI